MIRGWGRTNIKSSTKYEYNLLLLFLGDAVMIRGCGRTDFQEGDPNQLYDSVWNQVFSLPENFKIFPAHDYQGSCIYNFHR